MSLADSDDSVALHKSDENKENASRQHLDAFRFKPSIKRRSARKPLQPKSPKRKQNAMEQIFQMKRPKPALFRKGKMQREVQDDLFDLDADLEFWDDFENDVFDASLSTGLDSITEISGLEDTASHSFESHHSFNPLTGAANNFNQASNEVSFLQSLAEMPLLQSSNQNRSRAAKRPNPSTPVSSHGFFPNYKRLKRTSATDCHSSAPSM